MLKALELVGFKSFADKTVFEFSRGITAVVGPNGSGKSNVVDAIKWVLGEQSVKSLRGREMADVIFNGSAGRAPLNAAETTLVFDNRGHLLPVDTPEVQITRRVYRNGEGEYLINRQPSRLRDIRDLFAGTGFGHEAYGVIEQGKVDVLLQSSPRERRLIFEEAAGISRFKAKKVEALRRLERVDQNLLRLSDIVAEVEGRLRSVRLQASKARRYREHAERLQQLRTQVGLADWRQLSERLGALEGELEGLRVEHVAASATAETAEAQCTQLEQALVAADDAARDADGRLAYERQQIAAEEATVRHETTRAVDLADEISRLRARLAAMGLRAGDLRHQWQETLSLVAGAEAVHDQARAKLAQSELVLSELTERLAVHLRQLEATRNGQAEPLRQATAAGHAASLFESQIEASRQRQQLVDSQLAQWDQQEVELRQQHEQSAGELAELEASIEVQQAGIAATQARLDDLGRQLAAESAQLHQLRPQHAGASQRAAVLAELESRLEGLHAGVRDVLLAAQRAPQGPWRAVRGLVADLLRAEPSMAPLIDLVLADKAQLVVVREDPALPAMLERDGPAFKGRVAFLRLDSMPQDEPDDLVDLDGLPGVIGRADRFVETAPELLGVARHLLGRSWIVSTLDDALKLVPRCTAGMSLVTLAGEVVGAGGTLAVGPRPGPAGLLTRRSELRTLREAIAALEATLGQLTVSVAQLEKQVSDEQQRLSKRCAENQQSLAQVSERRWSAHESRLRLDQGHEQQAQLQSETAALAQQLDGLLARLASASQERQAAQAALARLETELQAATAQSKTLSSERQEVQQAVVEAKVEAAKSEERLAALAARQAQLDRDHRERQRALDEGRAQLDHAEQRLAQSEREMLGAESRLALLYLAKEQLQTLTLRLASQRDELRSERVSQAAMAQQCRAVARKLEERQHALELAAHEIRHQRQSLAERLEEDYRIDLAELAHRPSDEELSAREAVDQEIADLRRKINHLGNVNLDALAELDELDARFQHLSSQHDDLVQAKNQIEQIVHKINADSRRLFAETLEAVKSNFQTLFRKLFGGGQADIVLDEGVDMLESGIEIIARPPGKEPRNISLLSGGERTLTCVALLLAIFQYRPSPFCVLDEVDAALDEANIERFIGVLQEFLAWTQFIVVTHSKKTMTCASTLYGVTMEESGVSKRVAVRFEDVSAGTQLPPSASPSETGGDETQAA